MEIAQERKAALLEQAVINSSAEELSKTYDALGFVEMTAPALGLACRFRGLETAKTLIQKGASFRFPLTKETEEKYNCYIGQNYDNYRTNYSLYLLKAFRGNLKGACCLKGMAMNKGLKRETGKPLAFLADEERVNILDYLFENREKIAFQPEEMLFYAIYAQDTVIRERLRQLGVKLSGKRRLIITEGGRSMDGYWYEYSSLTGKIADGNYVEIMGQLAAELDGKPFHYTEKLFEVSRKHFHDINVFEFFLAHFKQDKMNKYNIIRGLIDEDATGALNVIEKAGWLDAPKKRDEMIDYALGHGRTEALAWLLDFKNRTADLAAEQEKAEKKLMRELNRSIAVPAPDSVTALRKIWSYKKQEDGTLVITNYKGTDTEVTVPGKIGKNTVTAIGNGAFIGGYGGIPVTVYALSEQLRHHRENITKITLPDTIRAIGAGAFGEMYSLQEIHIPESVVEIGEYAFCGCRSLKTAVIPQAVNEIRGHAFWRCNSLKNVTVPAAVKRIGERAFSDCGRLETVQICEGVAEIGARAFCSCGRLREVHVPGSVQSLETATTPSGSEGYEVFSGCPDLTVYCPEGSKTETYCKEKGFRFENGVD